MSKIVIQVNGGIVQDVFIVQEEIQKLSGAIVVDFDSDGDDTDPKITSVDKKLYAYVGEVKINKLPEDSDVQKLLDKYFYERFKKNVRKN